MKKRIALFLTSFLIIFSMFSVKVSATKKVEKPLTTYYICQGTTSVTVPGGSILLEVFEVDEALYRKKVYSYLSLRYSLSTELFIKINPITYQYFWRITDPNGIKYK